MKVNDNTLFGEKKIIQSQQELQETKTNFPDKGQGYEKQQKENRELREQINKLTIKKDK